MKNDKFNYNYVFVFYDVKEKRVNKVFKKCKQYLNHWQYSVFRGEITPANILKLEAELKNIIDENEDFISIVKIMNFKSIGETNLGVSKNSSKELFL